MSKSIDVLAKDCAINLGWTEDGTAEHNDIIKAYKAGYKQRNDELIDLLVELEEYFEKRQDADYEGEEFELVPNKEMQFYLKIGEQLSKQ